MAHGGSDILDDVSEPVVVRRSGGLLGRTVEGALDLASGDERVPEVRELVDRIDPAALPAPEPRPDMYVYDFDLVGTRCQVVEVQLTDDLRRLAELLIP